MLSVARGSQGEDLVVLSMYDGGAMASCPPWRCRIWSPVPVDVRLEVLREACLARVAVVMQRDHGCHMT
jgi:hypothetical protein